MAKTSQELAVAAAGITTENMGEKVRVHALAKTLGIASAEMVEVLNGQGIEGKRATSTLPKAQVAEVLDAIRTAGAPAEPEKPVKKAPAKKRAAAKKAEPKKAEPKKASATKTAAKKAPAKKKATGKATASATPEAPAVETTASEDAVVADGPRIDATVEQAAPKKTAAKKAEPKKTAAKKAAPKKTAAKKTAPTEDAPAEITPAVELITEEQTEQPVAKSTSRRRRGRKASGQTSGQASGQTSGQTTEQPAPQPELTAVADTTDKAGTTEQAEVTVDALIDRIVESVETPAPVDAPADAPADAPVAAATAVADDAPRKVRRRVVRRVGSRSAASDAELLRTRKEEQRRVAEAAEAADATAAAAATAAAEPTGSARGAADDITSDAASSTDTTDGQNESRSRRRGRRGRGRGRGDQDQSLRAEGQDAPSDAAVSDIAASTPENRETPAPAAPAEPAPAPAGLPVLTEGAELVDEPVKLKGSTRLESKRRWRQEQGNEKRKVISKAEFLARRENVHRAMVVRDSERSDHPGTTTQVGITEDGMLVEHFVTSETQSSIIGNIYLGRVQNVLSSMEAAFIDIGTGRNAVLYAGEVDWKSKHLHTRTRRIEAALKPGDQVLVQAIKDPLGHKGARLTNRLSFAGRYLVYVPGGRTQGISRKLPEAERKRLKEILGRVVPENGGTIIRTAAEGVDEDLIAEDVQRLHQRWLDIQTAEDKARERSGSHPVTMYEEPNMLVKVIRDIFNEDFDELVVDGGKSWSVVRDYVHRMAPDLESRVVRYRPEEHGGADVFADRQLDEQLAKALSRKVWLPSGGYLIIDRTEAMTVIDVNTGSFVGSGGNLEETVTLNNLEAAEEIVRQMRLRDMGGMIVVDFIDMVLPENRDLMLRRLSEFLGRDRTRHKVSEVTSLGLVQMTRKRLGTGLLETFSTECPTCGGRGVIIHDDPVEHVEDEDDHRNHQHDQQGGSERRDHGNRAEKRQARQQQETRRRHEQAREIDRQAATAAAAVAEDPEQSGDAATAPDAGAGAQGGSSATVKGRTRRSRRGSRAGAGQQSAERRQAPDQALDQAPDRATQQVSAPTDRAETSIAQQSAPGQGTPEQAGEPGARRGRRRVVRRVEQPATEDHAGASAGASAGDVAAIAAQAVARAGAEDPDEPSGADYVADEPQVEKVVASAPESAPESATDRRGRRRVRRVVRPAAQRAEATTTDSGRADAPTEVPAEAPAEVPSEAPSVPSPQSYAEAKAEFDASPRRRRQTRGRSRSDVAPVPEDFTGKDAAPVAAPVAAVTTAAEPVARAQKPANTPVTGADSAPRRGRRKVVRSAR
ncbi:translation initiation factor IF-2 N-terminal domain-containing protein [Corynebacterium terpenotabidum]|nr:translation initiation factor IF-2 N-terminal domain-containing protein [Corynebacterium terpenotabidum]